MVAATAMILAVSRDPHLTASIFGVLITLDIVNPAGLVVFITCTEVENSLVVLSSTTVSTLVLKASLVTSRETSIMIVLEAITTWKPSSPQ